MIYKKIHDCLSVDRMHEANSKELIAKLGAFTLSFEILFLSRGHIGNMKTGRDASSMPNAPFPRINKTYNTYVWAYKNLPIDLWTALGILTSFIGCAAEH